MIVGDGELLALMRAIAGEDAAASAGWLGDAPELATARLVSGATRADNERFFLAPIRLQLYSGDTALHVAAAAYDTGFARRLLTAGADVEARNRRGACPLHAATTGSPGSGSWNPRRQEAMIRLLVDSGADPNATAAGGVTPLHRAVRNRCASAVRALLAAGADPRRTNDHGSTALDLSRLTTGRGGSGSPEARAEQAKIVRMLEPIGP